MASFLYPRTVSINRTSVASTGAAQGTVGYQGETLPQETQLVSGIPATISIGGSRGTGFGELPADSPNPVRWTVILPSWVMPTLPLIQERDIIYDDLGRRFQVLAFEPNMLGATIDAIRLMA